ncbi:MAG: hypothetical protein CMO80_00710 [Verrucomicrobiales bacterium]|nr:hypothetical protein [Verrucomicrobiales bacterium]|tara:strand:- start:17836 stop:18291 length:456 start_codon:yes stop_codon:yes gene_type:complete
MDEPEVLIVEDSVEMADLLAISLEDDDIETECAASGEEALEKVRTAGIDFGSGVSSLVYLRDLPVNVLKIDGSFIGDVDSSEVNREIVRSVTKVSRIMNRKTVAEHVSSPEVPKAVKDLGVDYVQGWHNFEPAPPEKLIELGIEKIGLPGA